MSMINVYCNIIFVVVVGIKNMASISEQKCNTCEKYFPNQIFSAHQSLHCEDKFHPCNKNCGKVFTSKDDLLKHNCVDVLHVWKRFKCDLCTKAFENKYSLALHKKTHTDEKLYECEICKKAFSSISALTCHKRVHTGENPFECEICEKTFSDSSALASHKRILTGEQPYECEICKKTFSDSGNLQW